MSSFCAICCFSLYLVCSHLCGECCYFCAAVCLYLCIAVATYAGMELSTVHFWQYQFSVIPQYKLSVQPSETGYNCLMAVIKVSEYSLPTYLSLKLSTTKKNNMGCHLCLHTTSVCVHWKYPLGLSCSVSRSFDMRPAWGNPYIPLQKSK